MQLAFALHGGHFSFMIASPHVCGFHDMLSGQLQAFLAVFLAKLCFFFGRLSCFLSPANAIGSICEFFVNFALFLGYDGSPIGFLLPKIVF